MHCVQILCTAPGLDQGELEGGRNHLEVLCMYGTHQFSPAKTGKGSCGSDVLLNMSALTL